MKPIEYQVSEVFSGALVNADLYKSLGATEYSKPPSESLTQPFGSGCAQSSASGAEESWMEVCGNESYTRMVPSADPKTNCCPFGVYATDFIEKVCPLRGLLTVAPVSASPVKFRRSAGHFRLIHDVLLTTAYCLNTSVHEALSVT